MKKYFMLLFISSLAINFYFVEKSYATQTKYLNIQGASKFLQGTIKNLQINGRGYLSLSQKLDRIYDTQNLLIQYSIQANGGVYFSTAKDAGIFFYDNTNKQIKKLYENSQSLSISAFTVIGQTLYFIESPSNTFFKLDLSNPESQPELIQTLNIANYIWQMGEDGENLYLSTGAKAGVYKLSLNNLYENPELILSLPDENHILTMVINNQKAYLGGQGTGGVYEFDLSSRSIKTLYITYEGEVSDIIVNGEDIFFTTSNREAKAVGKDFDYTDSLLLQQVEYQILKGQSLDKEAMGQIIGEEPNKGIVVKNSLYHINQNRVNKLVTLDNISLNKILLDKNNIIIGTSTGRIFSYQIPSKDLVLLASLDTNSEDITGIISMDDFYLLTTSNTGEVYTLDKNLALEGTYTSEIMDLGNYALLGKLNIEQDYMNRGNIEISVRGGQTVAVDNNWSNWKIININNNMQPYESLENIRYIQYRVKMTRKSLHSPELIRILQAYIPNNYVPTISLLSALYENQENTTQQVLQIRWAATDPDKDQLLYRIYFKQKEDVSWLLLAETTNQDKMLLDTKVLPDGVYHFKLEVSDELDNSPERAGKASQISNYIIINNTPPTINISSVQDDDTKIRLKGSILSDKSIVAKSYFKINIETTWKFIIPDSGLYDNKKVDFIIEINKKELTKFENSIFFRAFDVNMNQTTYRIKLNKLGKIIHS